VLIAIATRLRRVCAHEEEVLGMLHQKLCCTCKNERETDSSCMKLYEHLVVLRSQVITYIK